jgi:hypothetical protein
MHGGMITANKERVQLLGIGQQSLLARGAPPSQNEENPGEVCIIK